MKYNLICFRSFPFFLDSGADRDGKGRCAASAWCIRDADTATAMAALGSAFAIRTGAAFYAIKVSLRRLLALIEWKKHCGISTVALRLHISVDLSTRFDLIERTHHEYRILIRINWR